MQDFCVLRPYPRQNACEFYFPPRSYTGQFVYRGILQFTNSTFCNVTKSIYSASNNQAAVFSIYPWFNTFGCLWYWQKDIILMFFLDDSLLQRVGADYIHVSSSCIINIAPMAILLFAAYNNTQLKILPFPTTKLATTFLWYFLQKLSKSEEIDFHSLLYVSF